MFSFYFYSSFRCMTILGQEWLCCDWIEHSDGRQNAFSERRIPNPGQEWSYRERIKYSDGRQNAFAEKRITNLGQEWLCRDGIEHSVGRQSTLYNIASILSADKMLATIIR